MKTQRGFAGILGLVIIIALVATGGYLWSQRSAEWDLDTLRPSEENEEIATTDWQTYRNDEYGFEMGHPGDWKITDTSNNQQGSVGVLLESPTVYDLAGYLGVPVTYRIMVWGNVNNIEKAADFGSDDPQFSGQSWWNISVPEETRKARSEYQAGEQIISTFRFTR